MFFCISYAFGDALFPPQRLLRPRVLARWRVAEARETLDLLVNWCDLCLPANEQAFAESHRIKIQNFQASFLSVRCRGMDGASDGPVFDGACA